MMRARDRSIGLALALVCSAAAAARAQKPAIPPGVPDVGQMAPDFSLPGADSSGVLRNAVHLSELRGQTVVIAFFIRARTKG